MKPLLLILLLSAGIYATWDDYIIPVINKYFPREIDVPLDEGEAEKKKIEGLEKKIEGIIQEALRAQAEGDKKAQSSLEKRIKLARRIVDIMKTSGVSQEEATMLASQTSDIILGETDPVRDDPAQAHLDSMYEEREDLKKQVGLIELKMRREREKQILLQTMGSGESRKTAMRALAIEIDKRKFKMANLTYKIEDLKYRYPHLIPSK